MRCDCAAAESGGRRGRDIMDGCIISMTHDSDSSPVCFFLQVQTVPRRAVSYYFHGSYPSTEVLRQVVPSALMYIQHRHVYR